MRATLQNAIDPAALAGAPGRGSTKISGMQMKNSSENNTPQAGTPYPFNNPADEVNRAKAIVLVVWMALQFPDIRGVCEGDIAALADTLYEAYQRLGAAEKLMGVHHE